jgi:glutaredoxin 3|tara:strand:+ start:1802 stop:2062 length:261 start_codon:yes stop_codon:yes gene_type:complete
MTAQVIIYSSSLCGFCFRAKRLLDGKGLVYEEISVDGRSEVRQQMMQITGGRTVPQIIINGNAIGGCDELYLLDRQQKLDPLLADY